MNKKLLIPLIVFLAVASAFLVQLGRNAQGDDPKALESALVGKPVPQKTLNGIYWKIKPTVMKFSNKVNRFS